MIALQSIELIVELLKLAPKLFLFLVVETVGGLGGGFSRHIDPLGRVGLVEVLFGIGGYTFGFAFLFLFLVCARGRQAATSLQNFGDQAFFVGPACFEFFASSLFL